jgi:hypothetical protein
MVKSNDAVNSLAVVMAREAGAFGKQVVSNTMTGVFGGMLTDAQETTAKFISGDINKEEVKQELKSIYTSGVNSGLKNAVSIAIDAAAEILMIKIFPLQLIRPIINAGKERIKKLVTPFVEVAAEKVKAGLNKLKNWLGF